MVHSLAPPRKMQKKQSKNFLLQINPKTFDAFSGVLNSGISALQKSKQETSGTIIQKKIIHCQFSVPNIFSSASVRVFSRDSCNHRADLHLCESAGSRKYHGSDCKTEDNRIR